MTTTDLQDALLNIIEAAMDARDDADDDATLADIARDLIDEMEGVESIRSYDSVQMLTSDDGLVLRTADGREFQITIIQSR